MLFYNRPWYVKYMEFILEIEYAILLIIVLGSIALIRNRKTKFITHFLKDHVKLYRRIIGGRWYKYKGHWEKETLRNANYHLIRLIEYKRRYIGIQEDGNSIWEFSTWVSISSPDIEDIENYGE